jgi:HEAT repeat protein
VCSSSPELAAAGRGWRDRARRLLRATSLFTLLLAGAGPALAAKPAVPSLASRLGGARLVVVGRVEAVESLDSGRVAVARIAVREVLKGSLEEGASSVRVVEMRDLPSVEPIFRQDAEVVAFLRPARRGSYLRSLLSKEPHYESGEGRYGVVVAKDTAGGDEVAAAVARLVASSKAGETDSAAQRAALRERVFAEIGATHPALVEDGAAQIDDLEGLANDLTTAEQATLERTLRRSDLPGRVRARLIVAVAKARLTALAPSLAELQGDAEVHAARWRALEDLGVPPDPADVERGLASPDADVRVAAAAAMIREPSPEGLAKAGRVAREDPDARVRTRVLEQLGEGGGATALPTLEQALAADPDLGARQAAARAIFQIGGDEGKAALGRIAFNAPVEEQRRAVAMLRALGVPANDPMIERIRREHPDAMTRDIAEHGLPLHSH